MNPSDLTPLISAITALIGSITGLIILIVHIRNHQPIPADKPADPPAKPGMVDPAIPG